MSYIGNSPAGVGNYQQVDDDKMYNWDEDTTSWVETIQDV